MKLKLSLDQVRELEPLLARANQPASPDVIAGQVLREGWEEGAALYIKLTVISRATAERMRAVFVKEQARRDAVAKRGKL